MCSTCHLGEKQQVSACLIIFILADAVLIITDKQNKSGTNPRYSFRLRGADTGCSRSRDTVLHSAGRYSEIHHRINNISVKSCERQSNSAQNSVKATDIRTNATDV